ncbi:MAG: FtsX-like permease family protein, partial [Candidatus Odinarchaeota archaeon]
MKQKVSGNKTEALVEKMAFLSRKAAVAFYLSKTSIRAFTVSLLSLIIALSLLAGSIYYTGASRNDLYLDILRDTETGVNGQVEFYSESYTETILTDKAFLDAEIIEAGLEGVYKAVPLYPSSFIETYIIDGMDVEKEILISGHDGLNDSVLSECKAGSRFPVSPSEVLVFAPDDTSLDVDAVTEVTLTYSIYPGQTGIIGVSHEFNLTVAAIMTDSSMSPDSAYRDLFPTSGYRYFTSLELFLALAQEEIIPNTGVRLRTYYRYIFDTSSISSLTAIETVNNILIMERIVAENTNLRTTGASSELRPGKNDADFFLSLFGLLTLPVLILLFLFVIYSLGANSSTKQKHIEFMKSKGDSGRSMFLVFLFEILVIAFTAVIVSTLAGLPVALLMGMSSGFLTFSSNVTISNYLQVINSTIVQQLVVIGICLTVITHVPAIVMLYRTKNDIAERDASVGKKKRFRFGTGMIEILLMVIGIAGIIIAGIITELFSVFAEEMDTAELHALFAPFLSVLMIFSPLFFLLGAIMFINKLITASFPLLSRLFQKIDSRLLVTAIKMLNVNIRFTARTSLVMAIAMSFLVVLSFLPQSAVHYNEENMYYENGADIAIRLGSSSDGESDVLLSSLGDIEELTTTKVIYSEMHYYFLGGGYLTGAGIFLGIMPDFSSVAYWKDSYGEPLENLVSTLYEQDSQEATPVLVDQHTLELLEGDKYKLSIAQERSGGFASYRIAINPVEQIDYFPGLYRRSYLPQEGHYICKYSFFTGLDEYTGQNFVNEKEIWGKILPGADPLAVTEKVKEKLTALGYSDSILFSATEELSKMRNSLSTRLLWLTVNYNLLGGLLVLLIVVVLFLYARSTQNTPEIGYSLALGMKPRQLLFLTVTESLLLFLISSISGLAIGVLLLVVIMPFITGGITRGPPFNIYFDGPVFLVIYGLLLLVMCLTGFIAALLIKRKNIASLVKDERVDYFSRGLVNQALIDQGKEIYPGKRVTKFDKLFVFKRKLTAGLQLSRSNMRLFIGSLLGLVIALSMLTGCLYYIEFSRPELYLDYFEEEGYDFLEFRSWSSLGGGKTVEEIMEQDQFLDQEVDQHGLGQLLQKTPLSTSSAIQERTRFDGQENRQVIRGYQGLDEPLLAEAVTGSRLPANRSEVLVVAPASSNLTLNQSITVNIVYSKGLEEVEYQLNLTVTGMYTSQTLGDGSLLREIFPLDEYHFILPLKYFIPLVQAVDQDLADAGEEKTLDLINLFMYGINYETID